MTTQTSRLVIEIDSRNAERNTRAVANELENLTNKGYKADAQMTEMSSSIKTLVGFMGGLLTINKAIAMADGYTQMAARIRNATSSAEEYDLVQNRVLATANTTYRSLSEAQEVYLSLSGGMKSLGKTTTQTLDLVDSLSFSFTHNATRTDQAQSAMDSLSKSMAKGKIDADAWISIVTGADNIIADMAKTTGKTEAEIRKLGAEGKASLEDLIKTLIATREQNEKLANNMENSLADGFTSLSNAVTVYLGKANESTSATGIMAGALGELATNLESVANVAMLGGVAYLTKTILAQTVAIRGSVAESFKKNAANLSEISTNTALTASEARKTGAIAQYTTMQLADAKATAARMTGLQRLSYIQTSVIPLEAKATQATAAHTAATVADTIAQEVNNKARSRAAALYNLIGGPIGAITLGVTALAAGYMYFSSRAAEANAKLEEQAAVAKKAKEELLALKGLEKDGAINDMAAAFERQNKALSESSSKINMQLNAIEQLYKGNKEVVQVVQDARNGTISMTDAVQRFNELRISKEVYESIKANTVEFEKNAKEAVNTKSKLNLFGVEVELSGRKAQTAVAGVDANSKALKSNKNSADAAAKSQKDFKASIYDQEFEAYLTKGLLAKGYSPEQVANMVSTANWAKKNNVKLTNELYQTGLQVLSIEQQNNAVIEARNKVLKENTKELEKQQKTLQVNSKVQALATKYSISEKASAAGIPKGLIEGMIMQESRGDTYRNGKLLTSPVGAQGLGQFMPATAKQYKVDVSSEESSINGMIKMMSDLIKQFNGDIDKAIMAYNAGPGNVQSGKAYGFKETKNYLSNVKAYAAGTNGFAGSSKDFDSILKDAEKALEEQAKNRKSLELEVANEVTQIREKLKDKLLEIDKAGYSPERAKELKVEYQARADNDVAIAEYALKTKLNDYSSFKKTEDKLLKDSFDQKKFYATRDIELSKGQRDQAIKYLNEEYLHELGLIKLAKEQRIFQAEQAMMTEVQVMQERYRLEREEIAKTANISDDEKVRRLSASQFNQKQEETNLTKSLTQEYMGAMGFEENPLIQQFEVLQKARENDLINEKEYQNAKLQLQAKSTASYMEGMFGGFAELVDENSKTYAVLFAAQKAFAVAQAMLNIPAAYSKAYDAVVGTPYIGPYIAPAMGAAAAALQVVQAASIKNVSMSGFATGGFTGIGGKFDPAGIVHKGEVVWSQDDIKRWGGVNVVEAMRTSQPPKGYSDGGLVTPKDTYRVGMGTVDAINRGADVQAERQAQANVRAQADNPQKIMNNLRVIMVKDEDEAKDMLYGPDGEKAFLYHQRRNRSKA